LKIGLTGLIASSQKLLFTVFISSMWNMTMF